MPYLDDKCFRDDSSLARYSLKLPTSPGTNLRTLEIQGSFVTDSGIETGLYVVTEDLEKGKYSNVVRQILASHPGLSFEGQTLLFFLIPEIREIIFLGRFDTTVEAENSAKELSQQAEVHKLLINQIRDLRGISLPKPPTGEDTLQCFICRQTPEGEKKILVIECDTSGEALNLSLQVNYYPEYLKEFVSGLDDLVNDFPQFHPNSRNLIKQFIREGAALPLVYKGFHEKDRYLQQIFLVTPENVLLQVLIAGEYLFKFREPSYSSTSELGDLLKSRVGICPADIRPIFWPDSNDNPLIREDLPVQGLRSGLIRNALNWLKRLR